jgi:two-component system, OmpR family, KDP operon response regulator KdpE
MAIGPGDFMGKLKRVLICDDEPQIRRAVTILLRDAGFQAVPAETARSALDVAGVHLLSAAVIDLILPDGDGVDVCRRLREWSDIPILVLSGIGDESTKIRALEAGADDYVTKPFGPGEFIARLKAVLRRAEPLPQEPVLVIDGLEVDLVSHAVRYKGEEVRLTPIEWELLRALVRNRGRLMTHNALLSQVWGSTYENDKQTLQTHMANLRRKLDPSKRRYIHTDFGVGYRFVA